MIECPVSRTWVSGHTTPRDNTLNCEWLTTLVRFIRLQYSGEKLVSLVRIALSVTLRTTYPSLESGCGVIGGCHGR